MNRRLALIPALAAAAAATVLPATADTARTTRLIYVAPGAAGGAGETAYATTSQKPVADNVGVVRTASRAGEKSVVISVVDGAAGPVAVRVEGYRAGASSFALVSCSGRTAPIRLTGVTELRVLPLAGVCGTAVSTPTTGQVLFTFRR